MNKKREALFMGIGILTGLALSGSAAHASTALTATPSHQPIYVNGQRVSMTAYSIGGSNYVKLRDIGKAVDFSVTYDATTNSIHITPNAHYQEEVKQAAQTPASSTLPSEEQVQVTLWGLLDKYPTNTPYGAPYRSTSSGPYGAAPSNCAGWATLCSDAAFGNLPWRRIASPAGVDSIIAGGWNSDPVMSVTQDTRNRHHPSRSTWRPFRAERPPDCFPRVGPCVRYCNEL